ncbi:MAG: DUF2238 domain-containing protein [Alphaproteobacteria bacterium]|nr:DUF2238 domain-containing protein [Alphaproteobacteria bacterium]
MLVIHPVLTTATSPILRRFRQNRPLQGMTLLYGLFWLWAAAAPLHREDWFLENLLVFIAVAALGATYKRYPLSDLSYLLVTVFLALHTLGSHYTYAEVPLGSWFGDTFEFGRNHYDRVVHLVFGLLISYPIWEYFIRHSNIRGFWCYFLPFAVVVASSNFYEFIEWCVAMIVEPESALKFLGTQGDVFDAQKDTGLAIMGALVTLTLTAYFGRRTPTPSRD